MIDAKIAAERIVFYSASRNRGVGRRVNLVLSHDEKRSGRECFISARELTLHSVQLYRTEDPAPWARREKSSRRAGRDLGNDPLSPQNSNCARTCRVRGRRGASLALISFPKWELTKLHERRSRCRGVCGAAADFLYSSPSGGVVPRSPSKQQAEVVVWLSLC